MERFDTIKELLVQGKLQPVLEEVESALADGCSADDVLYQALVPGMSEVGDKMSRGEYFIPEVLLCAQVMQRALDRLRPLLNAGKASENPATVVIGTVRGDMHDIGKNLVIILLEASQFKVVDLGVNVPVEKFINAVRAEKADIMGMSAMLTTTRQEMGKVIQALRDAEMRDSVKVMVGGASLSRDWAASIGADAYCEDCAVAARKAKEFISAELS